MDHHFAGLFQFGDNAIQWVPTFPNAKVSFNFSGFQPFKFFVPFGFFRICERFPQLGSVQVNSLILLHLLYHIRGTNRWFSYVFRDSQKTLSTGGWTFTAYVRLQSGSRLQILVDSDTIGAVTSTFTMSGEYSFRMMRCGIATGFSNIPLWMQTYANYSCTTKLSQ